MDRNILKYGIVIGLSLFLGYGFQTVGLQYTTPANAGFITGLSVVAVPFLSVLFIKKRLPMYSYMGVACAAIGLFSLSFQQFEMNYGDFLIAVCAFCFALHIVLVGKYAPLYDPVLLTTVQIGVVALLSWFLSLNQEPIFTTIVWETLIVTSLFATVLAFLIQNLAQQHTPPTRTAVIFAMEPVFAALCSFILIHEVFTFRKVIGCILILLGMVITELKK